MGFSTAGSAKVWRFCEQYTLVLFFRMYYPVVVQMCGCIMGMGMGLGFGMWVHTDLSAEEMVLKYILSLLINGFMVLR